MDSEDSLGLSIVEFLANFFGCNNGPGRYKYIRTNMKRMLQPCQQDKLISIRTGLRIPVCAKGQEEAIAAQLLDCAAASVPVNVDVKEVTLAPRTRLVDTVSARTM